MTDQSKSGASRRDFLKTSAVAAAGAGVLGKLNVSSGAFVSGDDTIRVGLIGCGSRGSGAATQALSTKGNVKLVAVADAFRDRIDSHLKGIENRVPDRVAVDEEHKFVGFDGYQKVIDSGVDLVILTTPPGFRPIHLAAAVKAGKHVFMEKPVATDAPGIRSVLESVEAAKKKRLAIGVGLQRHHQTHYLRALEQIHSGAIGDVTAMRVYWNGGGVWDPRRNRQQCKTEMEYQMRNWYYYNWLCGDHIVEQHIHNLDVGNWVKQGYPVSCIGMGGRQVRTNKKYGEIFDHHAVQYTYADGTVMFSECRHIPQTWSSVSEHLHGTKGVVHLNSRNGSIEVGDSKQPFKNDKIDPYQTEHDDLFAAIRSGTPYNEGVNGAKSTMTAIMGRLSTYSGKPIKWDQAMSSQVSIMPKEFAWDAEMPNAPNSDNEYQIAVPGLTRVV